MPQRQASRSERVCEISRKLWSDAQLAAIFIAIDPLGLGGVRVRSAPGPVRDLWAEQLRTLLPIDAPVRKLPVGADTDRMLGGLDFAATLRAGRPVCEQGVLAAADNGVLIAPMAERLTPANAALIAGAMDSGEVTIERSGISRRERAQFCCVLYDEGLDLDEAPPQILLERLAFHIDLNGILLRDAICTDVSKETLAAARKNFPETTCSDEMAETIAAVAAMSGVYSMRPLIFAVRAARASAALAGRRAVEDVDAETACRLVFGPRAAPETAPPEVPETSAHEPKTEEDSDADHNPQDDNDLEDMLVEAVRAAAFAWLSEKPERGTRRRAAAGAGSKSGALVESHWKGRPVGARPGLPRDGARLDLSSTLRAAAPWRKMRDTDDRSVLVPVYKDDIRIKRFKARSETIVIFAVDASGSSAMHRMAEAKGAVELMLADCYSRRDHVALIAFRGEKADLVLPPTRSLVRVRRTLSALPGGGGTPLAAGIAAAAALCETERRKGKTPFAVLLSDGRGNIALNGEADRAAAQADAVTAAHRLRETGCTTLFFDTANRPSPRARGLAEEMGAQYLPLPFADSASVSKAVKQVIAGRG
ncbi:MAG: magnesium chelatase subunit D [Pseudomonadota bacterium]